MSDPLDNFLSEPQQTLTPRNINTSARTIKKNFQGDVRTPIETIDQFKLFSRDPSKTVHKIPREGAPIFNTQTAFVGPGGQHLYRGGMG
ncbi:nucleotide exchange factor [Acrasis kona]|uniref:Nucleotide exchange factor n=1 Tax=Acrasis kona TaxID=1008807 RepID=A0AAW2ZLD5_9EUKA